MVYGSLIMVKVVGSGLLRFGFRGVKAEGAPVQDHRAPAALLQPDAHTPHEPHRAAGHVLAPRVQRVRHAVEVRQHAPGHLRFGFGFWILGFGFWVLGFGFWVLGFGI